MCLYYRSLTGSKKGKGSQKAALSAVYNTMMVTELSSPTMMIILGRLRWLISITNFASRPV